MSAARTRLTWPRALAVATLVVVALAAAALALRSTGSANGVHTDDTPPLTVQPTITPSTALFGDRVEAVLDVASIDGRVEPGSVSVETSFRPYVETAERTTSSRGDGVTLRRVTITLDCLTDGCLAPRSGARVFRFPPAVVSFRLDGKPRALAAPWSDLRVTSRLAPGRAGLAEEPPRLSDELLVSPTLARAGLVALAAVLAAVGAWLILTGVRPHHALVRWRRRRLSPLDRALEQLDTAARAQDEDTRRRVLDHLATRLGEVDAAALEQRSRRLAWERTPPTPEAIVALAEQVRTGVEGVRR
jgi:hypothetical protein